MGKKGIPERWEKYAPVGNCVPGTKFLPFKVPLKVELCKSRPEDEWFTPCLLIETHPMLKAIIDLTDTQRYYNPAEFTSKGVLYRKINIRGGGCLPPPSKLHKFYDAVDELMEMFAQDRDALIGVHCTHGLNRTGYLICKYMVAKMNMEPQEAIHKFEEARGYKIEKSVYVNDIVSLTETPSDTYNGRGNNYYSRNEHFEDRRHHQESKRRNNYDRRQYFSHNSNRHRPQQSSTSSSRSYQPENWRAECRQNHNTDRCNNHQVVDHRDQCRKRTCSSGRYKYKSPDPY